MGSEMRHDMMDLTNSESLNAQRLFRGSYKEKFHALRERFARITQDKEESERQLELCLEKQKIMEDECNLLLDVLGVTVGNSSSVARYLHVTPPLLPVALPPEYPPLQSIPNGTHAADPLPPPSNGNDAAITSVNGESQRRRSIQETNGQSHHSRDDVRAQVT